MHVGLVIPDPFVYVALRPQGGNAYEASNQAKEEQDGKYFAHNRSLLGVTGYFEPFLLPIDKLNSTILILVKS